MKRHPTPRPVMDSVRSAIRLFLAAAAMALLPLAGIANTSDPVLERRLMNLAGELRCLVCQNQTLAESNAELAADLRNEIREQMRRGATDQDVIAYLVARYGDFVLYRPPLKASTVLLWTGPGLLLLAGISLLGRTLVRRRRQGVRAPFSAEAHARARELLGATTVEDPS